MLKKVQTIVRIVKLEFHPHRPQRIFFSLGCVLSTNSVQEIFESGFRYRHSRINLYFDGANFIGLYETWLYHPLFSNIIRFDP